MVVEETPKQHAIDIEIPNGESKVVATDTVQSTVVSIPEIMSPSVQQPPGTRTSEAPPLPTSTIVPQTADLLKIPPVTVKTYTVHDVALHTTEASCWSIVNQNVYDLTAFIVKHPGGKKNILKICGKDGSTAFEGQHGGDTKPEKTLEQYFIGTLFSA